MNAADTIEVIGSDALVQWLFEQNISLIFSSYQLGKFFLIGRHPPAGLSVFQRNFTRCMGMAYDPSNDAIYLSSLHQIWKFKNSLPPGDDYKGYDRMYTPQACYFTGEVDAHDMSILANGQLIFVNTLFSCLSILRDDYSFEPIWKPPFVTKLTPEDRCHLNGVALDNGRPRYVTLFGLTNSPNGWRDYKKMGGVIMDIESNNIVCDGLTMPHSPRLYRDKLWVLNSGTGYFGYVDLKQGRFEEVTFCPGYLRGLQFFGDYAIVGLSRLREESVIKASELEQNISKYQQSVQSGINIIDLRSGQVIHQLGLSGSLAEIYDIGILPDVVKPMAIGIEGDHIRRVITVPRKPGLVEKDAFIVIENLM